MPILVVIAIFISIYGLMTPGAIEGLKYYIIPDYESQEKNFLKNKKKFLMNL